LSVAEEVYCRYDEMDFELTLKMFDAVAGGVTV
jgi:hypothetical protein